MWQSQVSTDITRTAEDIYRYLADFRRHPEWSHGLVELEPLGNGAGGVGGEFQATETVPARFTSYARVTALEPARRIAWDAWDGRMMRAHWAFEMDPNGASTRLVQRCSFEPTNLLGWAIFNLIRRRRIPKENRRSLERLKDILERSG